MSEVIKINYKHIIVIIYSLDLENIIIPGCKFHVCGSLVGLVRCPVADHLEYSRNVPSHALLVVIFIRKWHKHSWDIHGFAFTSKEQIAYANKFDILIMGGGKAGTTFTQLQKKSHFQISFNLLQHKYVGVINGFVL